jgi:2-succinyl-5-enolpyruvyl-6-hydroxy-3-cyclohexene-1-carboxylate synthase
MYDDLFDDGFTGRHRQTLEEAEVWLAEMQRSLKSNETFVVWAGSYRISKDLYEETMALIQDPVPQGWTVEEIRRFGNVHLIIYFDGQVRGQIRTENDEEHKAWLESIESLRNKTQQAPRPKIGQG